MHHTKFFLLILSLYLFGCTNALQPTAMEVIPTQRSTSGLPPTWTPTFTLPPSQTPQRTPTQTFTPLPSVTPLPATLVSSPTSNVPTLTVTATLTPTLITGCAVTALEEGVILQVAPFYDPYGLLPTMVPSTIYEAVTYAPTYFELTLDNEPVGWIDNRLTSLKIEGPCDVLPTDKREWAEFPNQCFFTPDDKEVTTYSDSELTEPLDTISGEASFPLSLQLEEAYCTVVSHAGPSFCVAAQDVRLTGNCEKVTQAGITTEDGWLWSLPDGEMGEEIISFASEMTIYFVDDPISGPKPPSITEEGYWYYVRLGSQKNNSYGWIWSSLFTFR